MNKINLFIDSNILFQDYFFGNKFNKKILDYSFRGHVHLFMSEIVRLELRSQFQSEILEKNREISKLRKDAKRLKIESDLKEISVSDLLLKFDNYYLNLVENEFFTILPYTNDFLPDIVDRAVYRKKPFTQTKTELKDAIIWKTYSEYVELYNLAQCILLTNNKSDFCSKNNSSVIHEDLLKDTDRFLVIHSGDEFIKKYGSSIETPEYHFQTYVSTLLINNEFVFELIQTNFKLQIKSETNDKIDDLHPSDIISDEYLFDGQLVPYEVELLECDDIECEILGSTALISGIIYVTCETEVLEYNSVRDIGEERYTCIAEKYITLKIYFNFDLANNNICSDFEVTDIVIDGIN